MFIFVPLFFALFSLLPVRDCTAADTFQWPMFLPAIIGNINDSPGTVTSAGQIWMDRNLGASQIATSSMDSAAIGDLYQWGRSADGHENRSSSTTTNISTNDSPGHNSFILSHKAPLDWRSPQNEELWQGASGNNNPCPSGFRLPTIAELETEMLSWNERNSEGAFASPLKLQMTGYREPNKGNVTEVGVSGAYWSSTVSNTKNYILLITPGFASTTWTVERSYGQSVRCIKD